MGERCEICSPTVIDNEIGDLFSSSKVVAMVGVSPRSREESYKIASFMQEAGYRVIPITPQCRELLREKCYRSLGEVPDGVDIVNIFPDVTSVPDVVDEAIRIGAKAVWMQDGVVYPEAARKAQEQGLKVIMNRCIRVEYIRHFMKVCCP